MDVMLDLETMGNGPSAAIIAIGAVAFDIEKRKIGSEFYAAVRLESSIEHGGVMDASTVLWWMQQSDAARKEVFRDGREYLPDALDGFEDWMRIVSHDGCVWGNGAAFDNVILSQAYKNAGRSVPWKFWNDRCYRTVKALYPSVSQIRTGTAHNALDDARCQAEHLIRMLNPV